jgi:hypothetical protein
MLALEVDKFLADQGFKEISCFKAPKTVLNHTNTTIEDDPDMTGSFVRNPDGSRRSAIEFFATYELLQTIKGMSLENLASAVMAEPIINRSNDLHLQVK